MRKSLTSVAASLAAIMVAAGALAPTLAAAGYRYGADTGHRWALTDAPSPVVYDYPPGYVGYLCPVVRPVYDAWGNCVGFQRVVAACPGSIFSALH